MAYLRKNFIFAAILMFFGSLIPNPLIFFIQIWFLSIKIFFFIFWCGIAHISACVFYFFPEKKKMQKLTISFFLFFFLPQLYSNKQINFIYLFTGFLFLCRLLCSFCKQIDNQVAREPYFPFLHSRYYRSLVVLFGIT